MTSVNDHSAESPSGPIDDATAEQLLGGRVMTAELEPVVAVVRALREASARPVQPSPALRAQMAAGAFADDPAYAYQPVTGGRLRRLGAALVASILRARLVTKLAAAGLAAAVLSVGTAGFAGSLPAPVQGGFESVVESVSPYQFPKGAGSAPGGGHADPPGAPEDGAPADGEPADGEPAEGGPGPVSGPGPTPSPGPTLSPGPTAEPTPPGKGKGNQGQPPGKGKGNQGQPPGQNKDKEDKKQEKAKKDKKPKKQEKEQD